MTAQVLRDAAKAMREDAVDKPLPKPWCTAVALLVANLLDREAERVGSHAVTVRKVREDWWAYDCHTCAVGGSASEAGVARWQEAHSRVRPVADDALLAIARTYLGVLFPNNKPSQDHTKESS